MFAKANIVVYLKIINKKETLFIRYKYLISGELEIKDNKWRNRKDGEKLFLNLRILPTLFTTILIIEDVPF